jgi:hypothetical protein
MAQCANPDCPDRPLSDLTIQSHWVQVREVAYTGSRRGEGEVQHRYAAVACSKRWALSSCSAQSYPLSRWRKIAPRSSGLHIRRLPSKSSGSPCDARRVNPTTVPHSLERICPVSITRAKERHEGAAAVVI